MQKPFYDDLLLVLTVTLITVIVLLIPGNVLILPVPLSYIPYILLLLFLPGYALLAAGDPDFAQSSRAKRAGLSLITSIFISILLALLVTYTPLKVLSEVMIYILGALAIILTLAAMLRRKQHHYVHFIGPEGQDQEVKQWKTIKTKENNRFDNTGIVNEFILKAADISMPQPELGGNRKLTNKKDFDSSPEEKLKMEQSHQPDGPKTSPLEVGNKSVHVEKKGKEPEKPQGKEVAKPRRRIPYLDLLVVLILTVVCAVVLLEPSLNNFITTSAVSVLLMIILPGYAVMATIYPQNDDLNLITRLVLSFGISYFLTSVIGVVMNYIQLESGLNSILLALTIISFIFIATSFLMKIRAGGEKIQTKEETTTSAGASALSRKRNRSILAVGVVAVILLVLAAPTAFNMFKPVDVVAANSTDFYVLGPDGHNITGNYSQNVTSGQSSNVTIVLINHENTDTSYQIVTRSNDTVMDEINVTLKPNEKKEIPYNFTASDVGSRNIEIQLFKLPNLSDAYHTVNFLLNIVSAQTADNSNPATDNTVSSDTGSSDYSNSQDYTDYSPPSQSDYSDQPSNDQSQNQGQQLDEFQGTY